MVPDTDSWANIAKRIIQHGRHATYNPDADASLGGILRITPVKILDHFNHRMHNSAMPRVEKKPQQSVTVVAKMVEDWAGSKPNHFMA